MTQWIESIDGKHLWIMQFQPWEMELLKKYHHTITRMTKMDFSKVLVQ